jgi:hypothetical protein
MPPMGLYIHLLEGFGGFLICKLNVVFGRDGGNQLSWGRLAAEC